MRRVIFFSIFAIMLFINILNIDFSKNTIENNVNVEIKGAVVKEGIYSFKKGAILEDLINNIELKENADLSSFSLSEKLYDGQLIVIPIKEEIKLISINSADINELCLLPGIGEHTAKLIINYRENIHSFVKIEDLMNVKGIGQSKFEKLKNRICL